MSSGYFRHPTIHGDWVVFVSEDDLWRVPAQGGTAVRLTASSGRITFPRYSPDGRWISYLGREEGLEEIYVIPSDGGLARRITFIAGRLSRNAGWTPDGKIVFSSHQGKPILRFQELSVVSPEGGLPEPLNLGPARAISYGPGGAKVLGRHTDDPRHWKRDRGGMTGTLWVDEDGTGQFHKLIDLAGDLGSPIWLTPDNTELNPGAGRIYFLSDHDDIGNLYSCKPDGLDLRRHTHHDTYYAYNADSDGHRIVYHCGADLYLFDPQSNTSAKIEIDYPSSQAQRSRKFVDAAPFNDHWVLKPDGSQVAVTTRGQAFTFPNWEGAVTSHTKPGERWRLINWLPDGRLVALTDRSGEEQFVLTGTDPLHEPEILPRMDIGRVMHMIANPKKNQILFSNQRQELYMLDLNTQDLILVDRGDSKRMMKDLWNSLRSTGTITFDWSPDGEWAAYSLTVSKHGSQIFLWNAARHNSTPVTDPWLFDEAPAFDPDGRYLYFISYRSFDPVYDNLHFEFSFPNGMRPSLVTLQKVTRSPFESLETALPEPVREPFRIDLEGIQDRVIPFPVEDGIYLRVRGITGGKVIYTRFPIAGMRRLWSSNAQRFPTAKLQCYDLNSREETTLLPEIHDFKVTPDGRWLLGKTRERLRVMDLLHLPAPEAGMETGRKSGWIDLSRVRLQVEPAAEWQQMLREAWRLQRDLFWTEDMSKVDWEAAYQRYLPLVKRVNCRSELSALIWEMQTELGIGHAYEDGGDYRPSPHYGVGFLGADFTSEPQRQGWTVSHIVRGDPWEPGANSPLNAPGVDVREGDILAAINGNRLDAHTSPTAVLVNQAGCTVRLTFLSRETLPDGSHAKTTDISVRTLMDEMPARYREWVQQNRRRVHTATEGRVGYFHLPDMECEGLIEFHRGYLEEIEREGLIIDVRYNTGGMVSPLLLEKLERRKRHIGFVRQRWTRAAESYPYDTMTGPMVAITNELAGSDGDLFSNGFKMMGLGPLLGKRTWGGVIGISPRNPLVDGSTTTQPENAFWFFGLGWGIENHGVEPDIEVENLPQDYSRGYDRQLERAIEEILKLLETSPARKPVFESAPDRRARRGRI